MKLCYLLIIEFIANETFSDLKWRKYGNSRVGMREYGFSVVQLTPRLLFECRMLATVPTRTTIQKTQVFKPNRSIGCCSNVKFRAIQYIQVSIRSIPVSIRLLVAFTQLLSKLDKKSRYLPKTFYARFHTCSFTVKD